MHMVKQMRPSIYSQARQRQVELWDHIVGVLSGEWERGWSLRWRVEPSLTLEELMEDLSYGRE